MKRVNITNIPLVCIHFRNNDIMTFVLPEGYYLTYVQFLLVIQVIRRSNLSKYPLKKKTLLNYSLENY